MYAGCDWINQHRPSHEPLQRQKEIALCFTAQQLPPMTYLFPRYMMTSPQERRLGSTLGYRNLSWPAQSLGRLLVVALLRERHFSNIYNGRQFCKLEQDIHWTYPPTGMRRRGATPLDIRISKRRLPGFWGSIPELWDQPEAYVAIIKIKIYKHIYFSYICLYVWKI